MLTEDMLEYIECAIPHNCSLNEKCHQTDSKNKCAQCLVKYNFIVDEPVIIECEHHICKNCEDKSNSTKLICKICKLKGVESLVKSSGIKNKVIEKIIDGHMPELYEALKQKFNKGHTLYNERKIELANSIETKRQRTKNEIDLEIEVAFQNLEKIRENLYKSVDECCDKFLL